MVCHGRIVLSRSGKGKVMSKCVVCGMYLDNRVGEPASVHGTVDGGLCIGWLEPTIGREG